MKIPAMKGQVFVGGTVLGKSDINARILADTTTHRNLKAREALTVPFRFLCEYEYHS
jgi:hypothetical protein